MRSLVQLTLLSYFLNFSGFAAAADLCNWATFATEDEISTKADPNPYSGRNSMLREIVIREPNIRGPNPIRGNVGTIDEFVQSRRFTQSMWWVIVESITAKTSRSFLRADFGEGAMRFIFYPRLHLPYQYGRINQDAQLSKIRISMVKDGNDKNRALEVIARDRSGEWQPFYYVKVNGKWVPSKTFRCEPVEKACIRCHVAPSGRFNPVPYFLNTADDFRQVGYFDQNLVTDLLKYRNSKPWYQFWE